MLAIAALMLAAASATPSYSAALDPTAPWWERFTFTMTGDGTEQGCSYQSSIAIPGSDGCGDSNSAAAPGAMRQAASSPGHSAAGPYTKITIERRFTPASLPEPLSVQAGDTLLGGQVLALGIDARGGVRSCEVVKTSGSMEPPYGCNEARTERFEVRPARSPMAQMRRAYMTVLVYGHEEYPT